ncbi:MAG: prolyl oligopeptidase family serine peptidase [Planctomycetaceae bacterium]
MMQNTTSRKNRRRTSRLGIIVLVTGMASLALPLVIKPASAANEPSPLSDDERNTFENAYRELAASLENLRPRPDAESAAWDVWADADFCRRAVRWGLDYDPQYTEADRQAIRRGLELGKERVQLLAEGKTPWQERKGKVIRGFRSNVDDSVQPYGLVIPASYDPAKPARLHVVLHGSTRPIGMIELRFMQRFVGDDPAPDVNYIELHPFGRIENCYRWAGETDVFEAIEAACRNYNIDRRRIVLRGMSMGASGTWHLGLKHPHKFVALGPYCGYVDTRMFSKFPYSHFVVVDDIPEYQSRALHMLDAIDYAANAGVVPSIAAMGEKDEVFECHVLMSEMMAREGLKLTNIISPGTGHVIDPVVQAEQLRLIEEHVDRGIDPVPPTIRFVTWTLKYNDCHWLELLRLQRHYDRAEIDAALTNDADRAAVDIKTIKNIDRLAIDASRFAGPLTQVRIGEQTIEIKPAGKVILTRDENGWRQISNDDPLLKHGKRPGVQGPIDDAFATRFLCVRGTGTPWSPQTQAWSEARLKRFAETYRQFYRGDVLIKDDADVTEDDLAACNLILFGDPGSNSWIARSLPHLPLTWTKETIQIGSHSVSAKEHIPLLIAPSPFAPDGDRYVVLNSGHTFEEAEIRAVNYLMYPRLADWAIMKSDIEFVERKDAHIFYDPGVVYCGYFDEDWK